MNKARYIKNVEFFLRKREDAYDIYFMDQSPL